MRPARIAFCLDEEKGALRLFMRAIRRLGAAAEWEAVVWVDDPGEVRIAQRLRRRVAIDREPRARQRRRAQR